MRRTNIYLDERQLELLRRLSESRREPVASLVREAVDAWLNEQGVKAIDADEWERRFDALLNRRRAIAATRAPTIEKVEDEVMAAIRRVRRKAHPARGR